METSISIKKAWNDIKSDKDKVKKIVIGTLFFIVEGVITVVPVIGNILSVLLGMIVCGYLVNNAHLRSLKPELGLCDWNDYKGLLINGFKAMVASLPLFIMLVLLIALGVAKLMPMEYAALGFIFILILYIILYWIPAYALFCATLDLKSFFNISAITNMINKDNILYNSYLLKTILFAIAFGFVIMLLAITIIGALLVPVVAFICQCIYSNMTAQYIRGAFNLENREQNG